MSFLLDWVRDDLNGIGGWCLDGIVPRNFPGMGFGLAATVDIKAGEGLLEIPLSQCEYVLQ